MGTEPLSRKLAAILYADVAGYSRLTGQDEDGTHRQLSASLDLISNAVRGYRGRVVHYAGDAVLADFDTVSDALSCAAAVQRDLAEHSSDLIDEQKVQFRIGVNLGEVIIDRKDIYGDGVNVAARLEALAEPGGICVSEAVRTAIGNKLPLEFEFMGEQEVKNIADPVRAYHVRLEPDARLPEPQVSRPRKTRRLQPIPATAVVVILVAAAGVAWWQPWAPGPEPVSLDDTAFPLPDRPSIAVLPFDNLSGDSAQAYFADGMTDDLITDLSRISGLFVIARNSSFTYKGKPTDARRAARELGVRYVLEGSVRRSGDQVRINAQLIDGKDGGHLWAKRYDGSLSNSFALQDQITRSIVDALAVTLTPNEATRGGPSETSNAAAYDTFLEGWEHYRRSTPEDYATAIELFEKAIAKDPRYARAHAALAATLWNILETGWRSQMGYSTLDQVFSSINKHLALALERPSALALRVSSQLHLHERQFDESLASAQKAVALEPGDADAQANLAHVLIRLGQAKAALPVIGHAMRLDPHYPPHYLLILGSARFFNRQYEQAVAALEKAVNRQPEFEWHYLYLAAAYGQLGQIPLASEAQSKFNAIMASRGRSPMTLGSLGKWSKFRKPADLEHLRTGLERARVPAGILSEGEKYEALVHETSDGFDVDGAIKIDAAGAKALFDRGATFIDVRNDSGWQGGHIPGAFHLSLNTRLNRDSLSRVASIDDEIVFYCEGVRCYLSAHASARAISWGFTKVYYFAAGFPSWTDAGHPASSP